MAFWQPALDFCGGKMFMLFIRSRVSWLLKGIFFSALPPSRHPALASPPARGWKGSNDFIFHVADNADNEKRTELPQTAATP